MERRLNARLRAFMLVAAIAFAGSQLAACGSGSHAFTPGILPPSRAISPVQPGSLRIRTSIGGDVVKPRANAITLSPSKLTIYGSGKSSATSVVVSEASYRKAFAETNTCANVATITPASGKGPRFTFQISGIKTGTCSITFTDTKHHKASLPVIDKPGGHLLTSLLIPIRGAKDKRNHAVHSPKYISPSTEAMTVNICVRITVSGPCTTVQSVVAGLTAISPGCSLTLQGLACTFGATLASCPAGHVGCYTATITTYDAYDPVNNVIPAGAAPLSTSVSNFNIADNQTNTVTFNFSGIPAQIAVVPGTPLVTQTGNVYDLVGPGAHRMFAEALDADNNVIAGIGGPGYTVAVAGTLTATVTQPALGSPRFTVSPPSTLAPSSQLATLTVTAAFGTGQTNGCAYAGAVCSGAFALDMQSLLAVGGSYSISLFAAEKGIGPISTITTGVSNSTTTLAYDSQGNLYSAETFVGIHEYALGSAIPTRTIPITGDIIAKMAVDPNGNLFALDLSHAKVFEYPPGATTPSATISVLSNPYFMVVDNSDDLWVGNVVFDSGSAVAPGGQIAFYPAGSSTGTVLSGLVAPVGMTLDPATKTLYVSDQTQYTVSHPYGCTDSTYCALYAYAFGNWASPASITNMAYGGDLQWVPGLGVFMDDADGSKFAFYRTSSTPPLAPSAFTAGLDPGEVQSLVVDQLGNMFGSAAFKSSVYQYSFTSFADKGSAQTITPFVTLTNGLTFPNPLAIVP